MKKLYFALTLAGLTIAQTQAQNPVISDQFTADPTAKVFDGKIYLYPSHDIPSPIERLKEWFCMADYHVFSSENLTDWKDHGVIVSQENVPWVENDSYTMWAPDCVFKNGKYYFYFPAAPRGEKGFGIGVAVAYKPYGPFAPMSAPIEGVRGIDPCVLTDTDGQSYIYWAGGGLFMAKLKDNMAELASEPRQIDNLPEGFKEGPFVFERLGKYYFTFPWVKDKTETLAYCMGDSPEGPFEFKGVLMDESPSGCWTNHHSIVEYNGQWYLFYHHNDYSPEFDKNRSVRIDSLFFNQDGTIRKVTHTLRGVGVTDARKRIHIDRYSDISPEGAEIAFLDNDDKFQGWKSVFTKPEGRIRYDRVDFGSEKAKHMTLRAKASGEGSIRIGCGENGNTLIAEARITASDEWTEVKVPVISSPSGMQDLYISMTDGRTIEIDWIGFN